MSNATVRVRFGFRLPIMPNALIVVTYTTPDTYDALKDAIEAVKVYAPVLNKRAGEIAAMLVCEQTN